MAVYLEFVIRGSEMTYKCYFPIDGPAGTLFGEEALLRGYNRLLDDPIYKDLAERIRKNPTYIEYEEQMEMIRRRLKEDILAQFDVPLACKQLLNNHQLVANLTRFNKAWIQYASMSEENITLIEDPPAFNIVLEDIDSRSGAPTISDLKFKNLHDSWVEVMRNIIREESEEPKNEYEPMINNYVSVGDTKDSENVVVSDANMNKPHKVKKNLSEAEIKKLDYVGRTTLHRACSRGKVKKAEYLIYKGVAVDALDIAKNTALHYAAGRGREKCVELLIKHGADVELKNVHNKTPFEIAMTNRRTNVIDVMEKLLKKNVNRKSEMLQSANFKSFL